MTDDNVMQSNPVQAGVTPARSWAVAGGLLGAILASACCLGPLALVSLGISGAWIGSLTALSPYSLYFAVASVACIAFGFWQVYLRPETVCVEGSWCARPTSSILTKSALWAATALVLASLTLGWWAPPFY
jgi:mercuric ion transport protein